jgi:uncharacterized protein
MKNIISKLLITAVLIVFMAAINYAVAQETVDVGETGWHVKRPVMTAACENGCPWGEIGDFVKESMVPFGYSVVLCRNCNRSFSTRVVSENDYPPPLDEDFLRDGTTTRINAKVDFGVTSSSMLARAYQGSVNNPGSGYANLRLIAKIEDPYYLLLAARKESGIRNLAEIKEKQMPIRVYGGGIATILAYYGITPQDVEKWGGNLNVSLEDAMKGEFDLVYGFMATPNMNPESSHWTALSQKFELYFFELPEELLNKIAENNIDAEHVTAHNSLLRGVNRRIKTLGRSGEAVFARDDTPDQAAYDLAKAIDLNRGALKWFIRVYFYDTNTVWKNFGVPLHPGAERYYREAGYIKD